MKSGNRSNALLVELLIVIIFFMLAATVLLQVFASASQQSDQSGQMIRELNHAQDLLDRLYVSQGPANLLVTAGFVQTNASVWQNTDENGAVTQVEIVSEPRSAGTMWYYTVSVLNKQSEPLVTLNNARYEEAAP